VFVSDWVSVQGVELVVFFVCFWVCLLCPCRLFFSLVLLLPSLFSRFLVRVRCSVRVRGFGPNDSVRGFSSDDSMMRVMALI
jgi:hypothetical protein